MDETIKRVVVRGDRVGTTVDDPWMSYVMALPWDEPGAEASFCYDEAAPITPANADEIVSVLQRRCACLAGQILDQLEEGAFEYDGREYVGELRLVTIKTSRVTIEGYRCRRLLVEFSVVS